MMSLGEFAGAIGKMLRQVHPELEVGLAKTGEFTKTLAASYPGEYQDGWAPLKESTIERKERGGWPVPSPLKRSGELAGSYELELLPDLAFVVGSADPVAKYQELGTSTIPPRPVTAIAMVHSLPYAEEVFGEVAVKILSIR